MNQLNQLQEWYGLLAQGFRFEKSDQNNLKVVVPNDCRDDIKAVAREFIKENKSFILSLFEQKNSSEALKKIIPYESSEAPLSFAQERLWFLENYEGGSNAYNIPLLFQLKENADLEVIKQSLQKIVDRHEVLRTLIQVNSEGKGYQKVLQLGIPFVLSPELVASRIDLHQRFTQEMNHVFILSEELPIRARSFGLSEERYLSVVVHHIAFDGWSIEIFLKELNAFYLEAKGNPQTAQGLPELSIQYKDFALWQKSHLSGKKFEEQLSYWKNQISGFETLNLIPDYPRPQQVDYRGADVPFELDQRTSDQLRTLAKKLNVSLYSVLLTAYYLLLRCYSNQDDLIIGTPVANRHYQQIEHLIGFFVNSLCLRQQICSGQTLNELIAEVSRLVIEAQVHQDLPFEKLVEELKVTQDTSRHPIFQVMFMVQSFGSESLNENEFLEEYIQADKYKIAKFDLTVYINDSAQKLFGSFNYPTSLFKEETIRGFIQTYQYVLSQFAELSLESKMEVKDLSYFNPAELEKDERKNLDWVFPEDQTIHGLFEAQVERFPEHIAVIYDSGKNVTQLTYRALNERANQLAWYLKETHCLKADDLVVLCLDRSEQMLVSILAILKAGAAYVPMDPSYPDDRIQYILKDTQSKLVLTNQVHFSRIQEQTHAFEHTQIESIDASKLMKIVSEYSVLNLPQYITSKNLAYVIYTSGTTGNPKGVLQQHNNVHRLFTATEDWYHFNEKDVWTLFHSYAFDFTVWEFWGALFYGGKLVIPSLEHTRDTALFYDLCRQHKVTVLNQTPTAFYRFIETALSRSKEFELNLRYIIFGGEGLNLAQLEEWIKYYGDHQPALINMYGITETTVHVTYKVIRKGDLKSGSLIGTVIPDQKVYVLNRDLKPLPSGAIGELYVGGAGLARGYLNLPELTQARFIQNPFQTEQEKRGCKNSLIYKTGDVVRILPDQTLEYLGRNDFQVKIRGYRIELGEIENALSTYPGVKQSVVLAKSHQNQSGSKYLIGYYVSDSQLGEVDLYSYLGKRLPEYMVPTMLVHLTHFPLTINGKLDRNALPEGQIQNLKSYVPPRTELEAQVCAIFAEVLGLPPDKVGIQDDFFRLGGDSIVSIQLVSRLRQNLGLTISVKNVFTHRRIQTLFDQVVSQQLTEPKTERAIIQSERGLLSDESGLLPIQKWFFDQVESGDFKAYHHWNQSFLIHVPQLDEQILALSVRKWVEYHDALRLVYHRSESGEWTQSYSTRLPNIETFIQRLEVKGLGAKEGSHEIERELEQRFTQWQSQFNLKDSSPLFSVGYIIGYSDESCRIFIAAHHLLIDSVSWRILTHDLHQLYSKMSVAKAEGKLSEVSAQDAETLLGEKNTSYRQWVAALQQYAVSHAQEREYWRTQLSDLAQSQISLESHFDKHGGPSLERQYSSFELDTKTTQSLLTQAHSAYRTEMNDLLLTAFGLALSELTQSSVNHIVLEGHGREELYSDININRTVGWFTTLYPVRLAIVPNDLRSSIIQVKEALRQIPNKGVGFGALYGYQKSSLPKVSFNYLGQFDQLGSSAGSQSWGISSDSSGIPVSQMNTDPYPINVNGLVIDSRLKFYLSSDLGQHDLAILSDQFKQKLVDLVKHTSDLKRSFLTSVDVDQIVCQDDLDEVQRDKEVSHVFLANSLQQGFIYHALAQGLSKSSAYHTQIIFSYQNRLEPELLKRAWECAIAKFPSLRVRFEWKTELIQIIDASQELNWKFVDLSSLSKGEQDQAIREWMSKDSQNPFELQKGNLLRVYLFRYSDTEYRCLLSNHHAILDGWSNQILLKYVHDIYHNYTQIQIDSIHWLPKIDVDPAYLQTQKFLQESKGSSLEFWKQMISSVEEYPDLSGLLKLDKSGVKLNHYQNILEHLESSYTFSPELTQKIKNFGREHGITINALFQYAWHKLLKTYSMAKTTVVGTVVSGRNLPIDGIEQSVGLFVNTLPLVMNHTQDRSLIDDLRGLQETIISIDSHSNINLVDLQTGDGRLFDSLFVFENYPIQSNSTTSKLNVRFEEAVEKLDYPLVLFAYESYGRIVLNLKYAGELFSRSNIAGLLDSLEFIIAQILEAPQKSPKDLRFMRPKELNQVTKVWNDTTMKFPDTSTVQELFERQVALTPNLPALIFGEDDSVVLTFEEFNCKANQLAYDLLDTYGVQAGDLVAISLDRSEWMPIGMMAVLKLGAIYVPIDPITPSTRIIHILKDSKARMILTSEKYRDKIATVVQQAGEVQLECLDSTVLQDRLKGYSQKNLEFVGNSRDRFCIPFTSGTSGRPKGVILHHQGVINRLFWGYQYFPFSADEVCCFKTSINFVDHIAELFAPILQGKPLVILGDYVAISNFDIEAFTRAIQNKRVTRMTLVPALLHAILDHPSVSRMKGVRYFFISGERVNPGTAEKFKQAFPNSTLINIYGSSEVSADSTYKIIVGQSPFERYFSEGLNLVQDSYRGKRSFEKINERYRFADDHTLSEGVVGPVDPETYFKEFVDSFVIPNAVDCSNPKFIGHMVSVLPKFSYDMNHLVGLLNQNVVKIETSGALTHVEISLLSKMHQVFYQKSKEFYDKVDADRNQFSGVAVSGGTIANLTALWAARNHAFPRQADFAGSDRCGISASLAYYGYSNAVILISKLAHYSFSKAASILGFGKDNVIEIGLNNKFQVDVEDLKVKVEYFRKNNVKIIAIVGIAGSTETGTVDDLEAISEIARSNEIHFHVDAAFGGAFVLSQSVRSIFKGIENADTITVCGHKQLFSPMGISICLFRDPQFAKNIVTLADYQSTLDSYDLGKASPEGSRSLISLTLHASFAILGQSGLNQILSDRIEKARFMARTLSELDCFELMNEPDLNIVNYRYIPKGYRGKQQTRLFDERQNAKISEINRSLQIAQFEKGDTFVSRTFIPYLETKGEEVAVFRAVLCNPLSNEIHILDALVDQIKIANLLTGDNDTQAIEYLEALCEYFESVRTTIGKPMGNTHAYVLNEWGQPLPVGAVGELYIGGVGVAEGYLNLPELTAEKFTQNPFLGKDERIDSRNSRLYRTGDLARWLPNGELEYLGRSDSQVKIRGFRIEVAEIENKLCQYPEIVQAVVRLVERKSLPKDDPTQSCRINDISTHLVGYYVANRELSETDLMAYLANDLPEYMIPSALIYLQSLPLTVNGKLDTKALSQMTYREENEYLGPSNDLENQFRAIFADILHLDENKVDVRDSFFRMGGDSISAIRLVGRIYQRLGLSVSVLDFFRLKSIQALSYAFSQNSLTQVVTIPALKSSDSSRKTLSYAQERLWFIEQYEEGSTAYHIPLITRVANGTDIDLLKRALTSTVERHEVLHSLIKKDDNGRGYLEIVPLEVVKFGILSHEVQDDSEFYRVITQLANQVFLLDQEAPIRLDFVKNTTTTEVYLTLVVHHVAFDGWSIDVFLRDVQGFYEYYRNLSKGLNSSLQLPELSIQYSDFAVWQRSYLKDERLEQQLSYWKKNLESHESLNFPLDRARPSEVTYDGNDLYFELDEKTSDRLKSLAKELNVSLFSLLYSGFNLFLKIYSNQNDIVIGTPVANRHYQQLTDLVGFFVNSMVLRSQIQEEDKLVDYIQETGKQVIEAQLHQDLPFEKLVDELKVEKDQSRHPLFQVVFGVQSFGKGVVHTCDSGTSTEGGILELYSGKLGYRVAKFDLTVMVDDSQQQIRGSFNYATQLFQEGTVKGFIQTYRVILARFASLEKSSDMRIQDLNFVDQSDYSKLVKLWNDTETPYPNHKTLHQLFQDQALRSPTQIAVVGSDGTEFSYHRLEEDSKSLAQSLVGRKEKLIAILSEKSYLQAVTTLAVMRSGHGYLPLNVEWPMNRILDILETGQVSTVLISKSQFLQYQNILDPNYEWKVVEDLLKVSQGEIGKHSDVQLPDVRPEALAYVIFTSGSTGKPKGVTISHQGAINTIYAVNQEFSIRESDRVLALSELSFDLSVYDLFGVLAVGGTIVFPEQSKTKEVDHWVDLIQRHQVTIWNTVPQLAGLLIREANPKDLESVRLFLMSGDWIPLTLPDELQKGCPKAEVISLGGATEGSIWSIWYKVKEVDPNWISIPYGLAMPNQQMHVLTSHGQVCPIGTRGEIFIGGLGVALNYWNDIEKTNASFIHHPTLGRLYRTGDQGRWNPNGHIEFMGRNDFQVKIRGYRIELGEIENTLSSYPGVKQSIVLANNHSNKNGSKYLVGYYVSDAPLNESEVFQYLGQRLPEYMVPSTLVHLTTLPLTTNGKLDRKALPEGQYRQGNTYVAPRTELEAQVCSIFAEVLNQPKEKVGIQDDFFRLGGDSIVSIQLVSQLKRSLGLAVSVKDVFSHRTVEKLFNQVISQRLKENPLELSTIQSEKGMLSGEAGQLPIQRWFFEQIESGELQAYHHWNQSFLIETPELDEKVLELSVKKWIEYHDSLRFTYNRNKNGEWEQGYSIQIPDSHTLIYRLDVRDLPADEWSPEFTRVLGEKLTQWQSNFNLYDGRPLYRVGYITGYLDQRCRIFFSAHHLCIDSVSWRILTHDLQRLYTQLSQAKVKGQLDEICAQSVETLLGEKGTSYRQWVTTLQRYAESHAEEKDYWQAQLSDLARNQAKIERKIKKGEDLSGDQSYSSFELDEQMTQSLLVQSHSRYQTQMNDLLLTAFGLALYEVTQSPVNHIVLEGHGREDLYSDVDITRTVGWFTSFYPVRFSVVPMDLRSSLVQVKETLRQIPNKGIGFGALCGYQKIFLPRISFNYLGQFDQPTQYGVQNSNDRSWRISSDFSGLAVSQLNSDPFLVSVNAVVMDQKLKVYCQSQIGSAMAEKISRVFRDSLEKLVALLSHQGVSGYTMSDFEDYEKYTVIHPDSSLDKGTLFIFPPGDCGYEAYLNTLVPLLKGYRLVLLNNFNVYASKVAPEYAHQLTHSELAEQYIACIKRTQPEGPYQFFGWSFGGVLAFEVARRLKERNEMVDHLYLLDSFFEIKNYYMKHKKKVPVTNRINYLYQPDLKTIDFQATNIVLMKATREVSNSSNENSDLFDYYAREMKYNGLDQLIGQESIKRIQIDASHLSWILDSDSLLKVASILNSVEVN